MRPVALEGLASAFLAAGRPQTELFHLLLNCCHRAEVLDVQLLTRVLELIDSALHLLEIRVDLRPVLVVDVDDFDQTLL